MAANGLVGYRTDLTTEQEAFGEIQDGKISVKSTSPAVTRDGGFFGRAKRNHWYPNVTVAHGWLPLLSPFLERYSTIPMRISWATLVGGVFGSVADSQLAPAIVQRVSPRVIYDFTKITSDYQSVHGDEFLSQTSKPTCPCVERSSVMFSGVPIPLHQPLVIPFINDGIHALRQRDSSAWLAIENFDLIDDVRTIGERLTIATEGYWSGSILPTTTASILRVSRSAASTWNSWTATITKRLRDLFLQVRHSIPRYCARRGAALRFPSIIQVSHG